MPNPTLDQAHQVHFQIYRLGLARRQYLERCKGVHFISLQRVLVPCRAVSEEYSMALAAETHAVNS